ncbi:MAG TPA: sigma-70 family RNA polymerase sigma factor [Gaiellaceae bacterium]|nr:sigma-70 family RNA polymerase sigma factor [Gaiellaceae bacterium]
MTEEARRERFEAVYRELYAAICGYALRRVRQPEDAAELIAETFATLWRRFDRCPQGAELRPWLFGVARRVIANQRRGERRRSALSERLAAHLDRAALDTVAPAYDTSPLARAFASLNESDRELLSLVAWEELTREELAVALGTSRAVVRLRLHRARKRLRDALPQQQFRLTGGQEHEWT